MDRGDDPFYKPRAHLKPQDWREIDGFAAELKCGHTNPAYQPDGRPYGQLKPGDWISCLPCQGQREVIRSIRVPRKLEVP